jgi:hypothetical protein
MCIIPNFHFIKTFDYSAIIQLQWMCLSVCHRNTSYFIAGRQFATCMQTTMYDLHKLQIHCNSVLCNVMTDCVCFIITHKGKCILCKYFAESSGWGVVLQFSEYGCTVQWIWLSYSSVNMVVLQFSEYGCRAVQWIWLYSSVNMVVLQFSGYDCLTVQWIWLSYSSVNMVVLQFSEYGCPTVQWIWLCYTSVSMVVLQFSEYGCLTVQWIWLSYSSVNMVVSWFREYGCLLS